MKKIYERPLTTFMAVETETGFMNASVVDKVDDTDSEVSAGNQEIEGDYEFGVDEWE